MLFIQRRYLSNTIFALFFLSPILAFSQKIEINDIQNANTYTIEYDGIKAKSTVKGIKYSVSKSGGIFTLKKDNSSIAEGKLKSGKLKLKNNQKENYLYIKITDKKVKIKLLNEKSPWELKYKGDKIKIKGSLGDDYGKIKYYSDNHKTKLKDLQNKVVAESKDFNRLSTAMSGIVITSKSSIAGDIKVFTMLTLIALDK